MTLRPTCKDATRLMLESQDRSLTSAERLGLRMHLWVCRTCPTFERQALFMRQALQRWRAEGGPDDPAP